MSATTATAPPASQAREDGARTEPERFAEALRPRVMGPRLAAAVGGPATCHVLDAKYEPGVRAVVLYRLGDRLLRGDLMAPDGDLVHEIPGRCHLVAPGLRVCPFPHDPDLPGLPRLMDAARLGPVLAAALAEHAGTGRNRLAARCRVQLLRYRPGKRATVLVTWGMGGGVVAKAYHDPAKAAAVAGEASALVAATTPHGVLRLAPTLAHVPELDLVVQRAVPGTPLDALVASAPRCAVAARDAIRLAAGALAELHQSAAVSARQRPVERELQRFVVRADRVSTVDPRLGDAAGLLARRLARTHHDLPPARTGLVHGDCKPSQFLLSDRQAYLLDLDHCGVSDQAADVGTFLASVRQLATRRTLADRSASSSGVLSALADQFLAAYLDRAGGDAIRARWQAAVALERKALRAFARAPGSPLAGALVRAANSCLDELTGAA